MIVEFDFLVFPDAPDIALVAHGNIAVIAAQNHLSAFGDDVAIAINTGIDGCLGTAVTDGFDFLNGIGDFHQPQAAGEELGLEVCTQVLLDDSDLVIDND